jgi:DNA-binding MarR family transcriptional regulator
MWRDIDRDSGPLERDIDRPDPSRGGRVDLDPRERTLAQDPRDVFVRGLDVPRGPEREHLYLRGHTYELRGSQVQALATVGAFRVVPLDDLRDHEGRSARADTGDIYDLRRAGLVRTVTPELHGRRATLVTLTPRGRALLEEHRRSGYEPRQRFYAGVARPRELNHDAQFYRAYCRAEYQRFLQEGNRGQSDSDGRPTREAWEVRAWAEAHDLPMADDHVCFPDVRIEYELDGRHLVEDLEIVTDHYRGAHLATKGGFGLCRPFDPRVAEEFLK